MIHSSERFEYKVTRHFLIFFNDLQPVNARYSNLNFHPLEVVSRYRDTQLQEVENYSNLFIL